MALKSSTKCITDVRSIIVNLFKKDLVKLNSKTRDEVTKIKINEVTNLLTELGKNDKVNNDNIINLLQYCDLVEELKKING